MRPIQGGRGAPGGLAASAGAADARALVAATTSFGGALYAQATGEGENLFFSPASVSVALAMTYAGARGETAAEMRATLRFEAFDPARLHATFGLLGAAIADAPGVEVAMANALFGQEGHPFLPAFTALLTAQYRAGLRELDFAGAPEAARRAVNEWTRRETGEKIDDLLPAGVVTAVTRLVLVNALYFKGSWRAPFQERNTSPQPFFRPKGPPVHAPLMHGSGDYQLVDIEDARLLSLPYQGDALTMVAILPHRNDGLPAVEARLASDLGAWLERLDAARPREVDVYLPRFRVESALRLDEALKQLGMRLAFDAQQADFSGMTGSRDLCISAVMHKAFVDVNEQGTTAAAATAVTMQLRGISPREKPKFRADHPFVFLIVETATRCPLFLGRLVDPA